MITIRLLDLKTDMALFEEAWAWRYSAPKWFQESLDIFKESWVEYLENIPNELHYGIFDDNSLIAIVRLIEAMPYVFNIHLSAKRKADPQVLAQAGASIREFLFDRGVKGFYGWLPTQNKGVAWLYKALGFSDTGERCYKGQIHGRLAKWVRYAMINPLLVKPTYSKISSTTKGTKHCRRFLGRALTRFSGTAAFHFESCHRKQRHKRLTNSFRSLRRSSNCNRT